MFRTLFLLWAFFDGVAGAEFGDPGKKWWIAHGSLMVFAWGFLFPVGALLAVYRRYVGENGKIFRKYPSFYHMHRNFQLAGIFVMFVAFAMGAVGSYKVYDTGNPFDSVLWDYTNDEFKWNRHVKIGISVMGIATVQVILGGWHHAIKAKFDANAVEGNSTPWKRPLVPSWMHVIVGLGVILLAYINLYQGFQLFNFIFHQEDIASSTIVGYFFVSLSAFVFASAYLFGKATAGTVPTVEKEAQDEEVAAPEEAVVTEEETAKAATPEETAAEVEA